MIWIINFDSIDKKKFEFRNVIGMFSLLMDLKKLVHLIDSTFFLSASRYIDEQYLIFTSSFDKIYQIDKFIDNINGFVCSTNTVRVLIST